MNRYHHLAIFFSLWIILLPFQVFADTQISENHQKNHDAVKIQWADRCAREGSVSIIIVIDENRNNDPNVEERFDIEIWSDSDHRSIKQTVTETGINTGIFEGTVFFYKYEERSPHRVQAFAGDAVYARYVNEMKTNVEKTDESVAMIAELPIMDWTYGKNPSAITYEPCTISIIKKILEEPSVQREIFFPSPLKQIQSGLHLEEIWCKSELQKMTKHDKTPVCVTYQTGVKLLERGWVTCEDEISNSRGHPCGPRSSGIISFDSENYTEESIVIIPKGAMIVEKEHLIPKEITVVLGKNNTVTWINQDDTAHGIASDDVSWGSPGSLKPGESFSITFNSTGVYDYHGQPGPWITGSVIVKDELDMINLEHKENVLYEINQQAIIHQENGNQEKFYEQVIQMQEKITEIAQNSLGLDIFMSDDDSYRAYFPLIDKSKIEIPKEKEPFQICNVAENIPVHLQNIGKTDRFRLFAEKYSDYPVELFLQDERRGDSLFHYGLIAKSDDGRTALTHFHADSCTNQITDSERYYISCHNDVKYKVFNTINKDDVLASLSHPDFCTIPLDSWRQSVYDYNQKIKEQLEKHRPTIKTSDKSYESVSAYQLESQRLDLLGKISSMYVMAVDDEQDIEEKIRQYNNQFGSLPEELLMLIEQRK